MAALKRFRFYDTELKHVVDMPSGVSCAVQDGLQEVYLGTQEGLVCCLGPDLSISHTFAAHTGAVLCIDVYEVGGLRPRPCFSTRAHARAGESLIQGDPAQVGMWE